MSKPTPRQVIFSGMASMHVGFSLWVRFHYRPRGSTAQAFARGLRHDPALPRDILSKALFECYLRQRRATPHEWRTARETWKRYEAWQRAQARAAKAA